MKKQSEYLRLKISQPVASRAGQQQSSVGALNLGDGPMGDGCMGDGPMGDSEMGQSSWASQTLKIGLGYHSDTPDHRDVDRDQAQKHLMPTHSEAIKNSYFFSRRKLPQRADVRKAEWPVENQGPLHSCTTHAVLALIEFLIHRRCGRSEDFSRLFLYKTTRRLLRWSGDSGATLRSTFKAAAQFGIPPEQYWPYNLQLFDANPDAFLYSYCQPYQRLTYTRVDDYGMSGTDVLDRVKRVLSDGIPVAFGFPIYSSLTTKADIPLPTNENRMLGGHAVLAVGYQDDYPISGQKGKGAIIFRNSWGPLWGNEGYGYLPYDYVRKQWAVDFWSIFNPDWLNPIDFGSTDHSLNKRS